MGRAGSGLPGCSRFSRVRTVLHGPCRTASWGSGGGSGWQWVAVAAALALVVAVAVAVAVALAVVVVLFDETYDSAVV